MSRWNRKAELEEEELPTTVGKTENIFTRHVKLITFLVCMAVFLAGFIPVAVIGINDFIEWTKPDSDLPTMTQEDVIKLSEQQGEIFFSQITCYAGESGEFTHQTSYTVPVEGGYYLVAYADKWNHNKLDYLVIHKEGSDIKADVLRDDIRNFFRRNNQ